MKREEFTVRPGKRFRLGKIDPDQHDSFSDNGEIAERLAANQARLHALQQRLYASGSHGLLIVLQAPDTAGKDGTIRRALGAFDPQGVAVTSFKVPTPEELSHDFLWRVHRVVPGRGMVGIFNRSHYEDVLVVRVRKLAPKAVWKGRFEEINAFEKLLARSGVVVVKFYLHISPAEQAKRLRERQQDPEKQWKFNPGDLEDRKLWADYMAAYEDALTKCNTKWAPWYVVPANHKLYRDLVVTDILIETLEGLNLEFPPPADNVASYRIPVVKWP